jgi:uncharacterized membrane protein YhaH (DUF805 family)
MTDRALRSAVWLFILIWLCVGSGIVVVSAVAVVGWIIAQSAEWIVAIAMAVTGQ